jgi:hypothetical protein
MLHEEPTNERIEMEKEVKETHQRGSREEVEEEMSLTM